MESLLGKILQDHYYIARQLAQNNYWTVYLAEDRMAPSRTLCIIKELKIPIEEKKVTSQVWHDLQELLTIEIMNLKQVDHHPQIPEIKDVFTIDKAFYFVREFIAGETLEQEIAHHTLTEAEVIILLQECLQCIDFIHQKQILHLNLKPSNIIRSNKDRRIFITDFGKLKNLVEEHNLQPRFLTHQYLENQEFTAPEFQQDNPVIASDIYALGKIAIYALSGKKSSRLEINNLDNYARSAIKDLKSSQEISISSKLANILNKMTCDRHQDRYQSVTEVLQALEEEENVVFFPPPFEMEVSEAKNIRNGSESQDNFHLQKAHKTPKVKFLGLRLWRIFVIAVVIIISLIVTTVMYGNKYRNFKEYNNERYNISLKYPQDWSLEELEDPITGEIAVLSAPLENGFDLFTEKIYLYIDELPEEVNNLELYSQTMIKKVKSQLSPGTIIYEGDIDNLDGYRARSLVYSRQEGTLSLQQMEIFTVKGNRAYIFTYTAEDIKYQKFLKITKKILRSLEI